MKKLAKRVQKKLVNLALRSGEILREQRAEGFVDSASASVRA